MIPYLKEFLANLQKSKYSKETIYNYERDLNVFDDYLNKKGLFFKNLKKDDIEQYKTHLSSIDRKTSQRAEIKRQLGSYSVNRMLSSLRNYLGFLLDSGYQSPLYPGLIRLTKSEKKEHRIINYKDLIKIIESPGRFEKHKEVALRNRAIFELIYATGMRISEVVNLNRDQIDKDGKIYITLNQKKHRVVYLNQRAFEHIKNYLNTRRDESPALFVPYRGLNVRSSKRRISINYIQAQIKKYREGLGIDYPVSAHSLRHGFATYLAESGANPAAIQILLGHESLDTTTRYVHASDRYAEQTMKKYHPLKKI